MNTLKPTFKATYTCSNLNNLAKAVEIILENESGAQVWNQVKELDPIIEPLESAEVEYEDEPLSPGFSYTWKVRFKNEAGWGPWARSHFKIGEHLSINANAKDIKIDAGTILEL
ncbi:hypothetical protein AKJ56_01045 [candidate division MSBL1 archaeon SCGC-AAA382N08]|uniref:Fibronectin type-III domain-containing protein n=1 Tax=candidate division MSBL1 archaeon SCGC-AAA382N08 TaxID=1698285 RepID=A0A133VQ00_9EURY|nr:hypothetical protein AKJ56_01045 [candidate division MSBL1 archaeon SCGC-AAA382N08]